ncbi:MAG: hypothetical protein R3C11_16865 [Planctomycetaceae bacterium]
MKNPRCTDFHSAPFNLRAPSMALDEVNHNSFTSKRNDHSADLMIYALKRHRNALSLLTRFPQLPDAYIE